MINGANGKRVTIAACGLFVMLGFLVSGLSLLRAPVKDAPVLNPTAVATEAAPQYILKLYQGRVAVFDARQTKTPVQTTEIYEETLRNYDRELLTTGIPVSGEQELLRLLEDFGS